MGRWVAVRSFVAWLLVGAAYALGVLGALSIGVFALAFAVAVTVVLLRRRAGTEGVPGLVAGVGVVALAVAVMNRDGPGEVCTRTATSVSCADQWSPWPWLAIGAALISGGLAWFVARRRGALH
jgi:uncharacterized membrane protein